MLNLGSSLRYCLYMAPCDMRKGFDGLSGLVQAHCGEQVTSGTVFVFVNKQGDRMKLLRWEPGGLVIYYKRLERGRFKLPKAISGQRKVGIGYAELAMIIEGLSAEKITRQKRWL